MDKLIEKFKALGDKNRFKIFILLSKNQICVGGLAKTLGISESAVSQHLKVLKSAGLIKGEKVGYFTHYNVQKGVLKEMEGLISELSQDTLDLEQTRNELNVDKFDCTQVCGKKEQGNI